MLLKYSALVTCKDATAEGRRGLTGLDETFPRYDIVILYGYL
jgi:hypothetical protein